MVKFWRSGTVGANLIGHTAGVSMVAFSSDGKTLASSSEDKTVILWNLERSVELDKVIASGCNWVQYYLRTNTQLQEKDAYNRSQLRHLCERAGNYEPVAYPVKSFVGGIYVEAN